MLTTTPARYFHIISPLELILILLSGKFSPGVEDNDARRIFIKNLMHCIIGMDASLEEGNYRC